MVTNMMLRRLGISGLLVLLITAAVGCSVREGCDGSLVDVEGPTPPEDFWTDPFDGETIDASEEADLPFEPVEPDLPHEPVRITWTKEGTSQSTGRISRLPAAPGATVGPRIAWAYETDEGRFFVQQALVAYTDEKLEREANRCDTLGASFTNPGFSMTELDDGHEALLIAQSIVMSVIWVQDATVVDEAAVAGYRVVQLETQVRAPGDELSVDQLLDIANDIQN